MKILIVYGLFFILAIVLTSCGSRSGNPSGNDSSASTRPHQGSTLPTSPTKPQVGSVAYYCPSKMIKDQEYFVTVSISKDSLQALIQEVRNEVAQQSSTNNPSEVKGDSIWLADKIKVDLICSEDYFKKISLPQNLEQDFGSVNTLEWDWLIQPLAVNRSIPIEIHISAFNLKGDGTWVDAKQPDKYFYINVQVDPRDFWDKIITMLSNDPKFLLSQIIIPIITFLGGIWFGKMRKKSSKV